MTVEVSNTATTGQRGPNFIAVSYLALKNILDPFAR